MKNDKIFDVHGDELDVNDYLYIVYAKDKLLSGWGKAPTTSHWQLILVKDIYAREVMLEYLHSSNTYSYINWALISDLKKLLRSKKSYSIRDSYYLANIKNGKIDKGDDQQ